MTGFTINRSRSRRGVPAGPLHFPTPAGGPRVPKTTPAPVRNHRSKKGYTGSRAGLGRMSNGTVFRAGPGGPRRFAGSAQLPPRMTGTASKVSFKASKPKAPSIFARIKNRARRTAAAFGL
jgi:hypothetical protein